MSAFHVLAVQVGRARDFGPGGRRSAIDKAPVDGAVRVTPTGLDGDEQADTRHHGGPDKAVHAYVAAHYAAWRAELPRVADRFRRGTFGENLVVEGITESEVCLGDRFAAGDVVVEVSQGRQPCWKLNVRFDQPDMARRVQASGRTGWYFRVVAPGTVQAGQRFELCARPNPGWSLDRVCSLLYRDTLDRASLEAFSALPGLPDSWRRLALRRLQSGQVEDWSPRVSTPS